MSRFVPTTTDLCDSSTETGSSKIKYKNIAVDISSNSNSALFYAQKGCLYVESNSAFHGSIVGEKIHVSNKSTVEYDPALASAEFSPNPNGGWQIVSFSQN
jgi:hypothetical protein